MDTATCSLVLVLQHKACFIRKKKILIDLCTEKVSLDLLQLQVYCLECGRLIATIIYYMRVGGIKVESVECTVAEKCT